MVKWTLAIVCGCALALPALAQNFADWDTNGDGVVSREEFQGPEKMWARLDANGDGQLSGDELGARPTGDKPEKRERPEKGDRPDQGRERVQARFAELDANGDGFLTADEFPRQGAIEILDADGDGQVSLDEYAARLGNDQGRNIAKRLREADADGDGQISREEFPGKPELFDLIDGDTDGFLTPEEIKTHAAQFAQGEGRGPGKVFERLDLDQSGTLTAEEWDERLSGRFGDFATVDLDGDGQVTKEEAAEALRALRDQKGEGDKPKRERKKDPAID